jgi:Thioredoxin domain
MLIVKILSLGGPERYAVRRLVTAACQELRQQYPDLEVSISEVSEASEIGKVAYTLILPTLVINEKVVCTGRFPGREEVGEWLRQAMNKT